MCLITLVAAMILIALLGIVSFVKTAVIVLPWTALSAVIAAAVSIAAVRRLVPEATWRIGISMLTACLMTIAIGYLTWSLFPIQYEPAESVNPLEWPEPTAEQVIKHFPRHLFAWSMISAAGTAISTLLINQARVQGKKSEL